MLTRLFLFLLLLPCFAPAQEYAYHRYEGAIGGKPVVFHLHKHTRTEYVEGETTASEYYRGTYYYTRYDMPIGVNGAIGDDGKLELAEFSGSLKLTLAKGSLSGAWSNEDGSKQYPVELKENYPAGTVSFTGAGYYGRKALFPQKDSSPGMEVHLSWLEPADKTPEATRTFLREAIHHEMLGTSLHCCPGGKKVFEALRDEQFRMYNEEFRESLEADPDMPEHMMNFSDDHSVSVLYNTDHLLSLGFNHYLYSGGAHGNYATITRSYDLKKNKTIELSDVLKPGYETALEQALEQAARRFVDMKPTEELSDYFLVDHIPVTDNFYLTSTGIVFSYPPYEIAAYVYGQVDLFVPFKELEAWKK